MVALYAPAYFHKGTSTGVRSIDCRQNPIDGQTNIYIILERYPVAVWACVLRVTVCQFDVESERSRSGTITSPNYPGLYPRNINCRYVFHGPTDKRVTINFTHFDVEGLSPA